MPKLYVTDLAGNQSVVEGEPGLSVMEIIRDNDFEDLAAICGGCCSCATCHVYVDDAWLGKLPAAEEDEHELVSETDAYQPNSRLSCQLEFSDALDGLKVTIAPGE